MPENPCAFPQPFVATDGRCSFAHEYGYGGMSLRDYFAGQALASHTRARDLPDDTEAARWAYEYADEMLAAREKGGADASS